MRDYLSPGVLAAVLLIGGSAFAGENDTGNSSSQPVAQNIEITETRLPSGDSEIHVSTGPDRPAAVYRIRLTPHHHPATSPQAPAIKRWASWKYGAFLCFNSNQFTGQEHCRAKAPKMFAPNHLDVSQWISTFKAAGMRYAVLTARHTSGFLLWDSLTSRHDVAASGDRTDLVKVYVEECRRQGVAAGLYYCLWGGSKCGATGRVEVPGARATILAQLHELATRNGPIPYFWIDMMNWAPQDLTAQEIYDSLKNVDSQTIVILNQHIQDGRDIRYFPTDVLNGEMHSPPAERHQAYRQVNGQRYYLPFEYEPCSQRRVKTKGIHRGDYGNYCWFTYGSGRGFEPSTPFAADFLLQWIKQARDRGASNVLLACAPDHTGRIRDEDARQLCELGQLLRKAGLLP